MSKRKGAISISVYLIFLLIIGMIVTAMYVLVEEREFSDSYFDMRKNDYEAKYAIEVLKLNFYYSISESYNMSKDEKSFFNNYTSFDNGELKAVISEKYFEDSRCNFFYPRDVSDYKKIKIERNLIEFYIIVEYRNGETVRKEALKCRIYSPYEKYGIVGENIEGSAISYEHKLSNNEENKTSEQELSDNEEDATSGHELLNSGESVSKVKRDLSNKEIIKLFDIIR